MFGFDKYKQQEQIYSNIKILFEKYLQNYGIYFHTQYFLDTCINDICETFSSTLSSNLKDELSINDII